MTQGLLARPSTVDETYARVCTSPSDIYLHLPRLRTLAHRMRHVTEFGTRHGISTVALLAARPQRLITYDVVRQPEVDFLEHWGQDLMRGFEFRREDTRECEIEPTDFLFIDTLHAYEQLKRELRVAPQVRHFMAFHDTTTYGEQDENYDEPRRPGPGLNQALREFLEDHRGIWTLLVEFPECNGLTVLKRVGTWTPVFPS